jgi:hypothetical protein
VGLIEKYGTGIRRVLREFEAYSLPMPKFVFELIPKGWSHRTYEPGQTPQSSAEMPTDGEGQEGDGTKAISADVNCWFCKEFPYRWALETTSRMKRKWL